MASKPIEPGCLAILKGLVRHPEFNGMTVQVTAYSPKFSAARGEPVWLVDLGVDGRIGARERHLMRIDGGDPDAVQVENQDQEVPSHVSA